MKTKITSNLIASITMALVPLGPLALLLPAGEVAIGILVAAVLASLGYMELRNGAAAKLPRRQPRGSIGLFRRDYSL